MARFKTIRFSAVSPARKAGEQRSAAREPQRRVPPVASRAETVATTSAERRGPAQGKARRRGRFRRITNTPQLELRRQKLRTGSARRNEASAPQSSAPRRAPGAPLPGSGKASGPGVVGIADLKVLRHSGQLITHGLGSCVAVLGYDEVREIGGLLHFVSPAAAKDPEEAIRAPATFADSGIKALLWALNCAGAHKKNLRFYLVGGACMSGCAGVLHIGKKNVLAARKALWSAGGVVESEHVGGVASRTVRMDVASGRVQLRLGTGELINL